MPGQSATGSPLEGRSMRLHPKRRYPKRRKEEPGAFRAVVIEQRSANKAARGEDPAVRSRGVPSMCDYSLHYVASRPAQVSDKLVTTNFPSSTTRGFSAVGEPNVAICLLP